MIIGGLLSGIALYKLFKVNEIPGNEHLLIWIVVLYTGWTIFQIPYLSIGYNLEGIIIKELDLVHHENFCSFGVIFIASSSNNLECRQC